MGRSYIQVFNPWNRKNCNDEPCLTLAQGQCRAFSFVQVSAAIQHYLLSSLYNNTREKQNIFVGEQFSCSEETVCSSQISMGKVGSLVVSLARPMWPPLSLRFLLTSPHSPWTWTSPPQRDVLLIFLLCPHQGLLSHSCPSWTELALRIQHGAGYKYSYQPINCALLLILAVWDIKGKVIVRLSGDVWGQTRTVHACNYGVCTKVRRQRNSNNSLSSWMAMVAADGMTHMYFLSLSPVWL